MNGFAFHLGLGVAVILGGETVIRSNGEIATTASVATGFLAGERASATSSLAPSIPAEFPWHVELGVRGGHTKLGSSKQQLDRRLDLPLRLDVLGVFDEPYTPLDRKSDWGFSTLHLGVGRQFNEWLVWTWYAGGGTGGDQDHQRVAAAALDVDFKYAAAYSGLIFELYPWGVPKAEKATNWTERWRAGRPFLLGGLETAYVSAEGRGEYSVAWQRVYGDKVTIRDFLVSRLVGVGWGVPLGERWSMHFSLSYSFHHYRPEEYNSWNVVSAIRYRF